MGNININSIKTKYAVKLDALANSFFDPYSKCNLFRKTPYYCFDHAPTKAIISGVKSGKLIDLKDNILSDAEASTSTPTKKVETDVEALKKQLRKEIESEVRAEMAMKAEEEASKKNKEASAEEVKDKAPKKTKKDE